MYQESSKRIEHIYQLLVIRIRYQYQVFLPQKSASKNSYVSRIKNTYQESSPYIGYQSQVSFKIQRSISTKYYVSRLKDMYQVSGKCIRFQYQVSFNMQRSVSTNS